MMSIQMTSPQEWIKTIIIIIVMTQPMKTAPIINKTKKSMNMLSAPTQPKNMMPTIPTILQKITNKRWQTITLYTRYQE